MWLNRKKRYLLVLCAAGLLLLPVVLVVERHRLLEWFMRSDSPPAMLDPADEGPSVSWHDDYFTVETLAPGVFAIGEPRYLQQNINYLIVGDSRAVLFDAGSGYRDIRPVVKALTDKPLTFVPSHFHYDHVGNEIQFERVALVDLPYIRARAPNNQLQLLWQEHLGSAEGYTTPTLTISQWLAPGDFIDLGGKQLQVILTPGHTPESISLYDAQEQLLFSGDYIYQGPLYGFLANSSLSDYRVGADSILQTVSDNSSIFGAHRNGPPGTPRLAVGDVEDLGKVLDKIKSGQVSSEGSYPVSYEINDNVSLLAEPAWLQDW